jgi:hypothetical protein
MHLSENNLRKCLEWHAEGHSYAKISRALGLKSQGTIFEWMQRSKAASDARDLSSVFYLEYPKGSGERRYWTDWLKHFRARRALDAESILVEQIMHGVEEIVRDGSGRVVYKLNPKYLDWSADEFELAGLTYFDRYLLDANRMPIPETRTIQSPATLKIKALEALLPAVWGQRQSVDVHQTTLVRIEGQSPADRSLLPASKLTPLELRLMSQLGAREMADATPRAKALPAPAVADYAKPQAQQPRKNSNRLDGEDRPGGSKSLPPGGMKVA